MKRRLKIIAVQPTLRRQLSRIIRVDIMISSVIVHPEKIKNMHMDILKVTKIYVFD